MRAMTQALAALYPLHLLPIYKDYLWGGARIPRLYQRVNAPKICAESWEVADRPEGQSRVAEGPLAGWTLREVVAAYGADLLGRGGLARFPLLVKLIDAEQTLSVQVHPSEKSCPAGAEPKTEAWYVLAAAAGAAVYAGVKSGVDAAAFRQALATGGVEKLLEKIEVGRGDVIYVPGGLVHAICAGCLLLEVQQNSNTTYRVYDWERLGADGRPRPLHVEAALQVIDWRAHAVLRRAAHEDVSATGWTVFLETPFFRMERLHLKASDTVDLAGGGNCRVLFASAGAVSIEADNASPCRLAAGSTALIPAALRNCRIIGLANAELIAISV